MRATDKQIEYLEALTKKVCYIIDIWPDNGINADMQKFYRTVSWRHEQRRGMTVTDASVKISTFRDLIFNLNFKRILFNLPQF